MLQQEDTQGQIRCFCPPPSLFFPLPALSSATHVMFAGSLSKERFLYLPVQPGFFELKRREVSIFDRLFVHRHRLERAADAGSAGRA